MSGRGMGGGMGLASRQASFQDVARCCWRYWRREPWTLALVGALILAIAAADLIVPLAVGALVDAVAGQKPGEGLSLAQGLAAIAGAAMIAAVLLKQQLDRVWNGFSARILSAIQIETFSRVQRFGADWHANTFAGATVHKISRARWALDAITGAVVRLTPLAVLVVGLGAALALRLPAAGVMFFATAALLIYVSWITASRYVRPANIEAAERDSRLTAVVADSIGNNPAVKSFGAEQYEDARVREAAAQWRAAAIPAFNRSTDMNALQQLIWTVLQTLILLGLAAAAASGAASAGDVAFAAAANLQLGGHLRSIGGDIRMLQRAFSEIADAIGFLDRAPDVQDPVAPKPFVVRRGEIRFERVWFAYGDHPPLYRDFSLRIAPGERVGLVGRTGAGKTTFVKLVQRLYDVTGGAILIDDVAISEAPQASLRRAIAVVPQEPALFHRSLAENIAYARPGASMSEVVAAATRARAHGFIEALPRGYDTLVGERGVKLSGGERQRVALARAFLADAPILILDEATSSLDVETERLVQAAIEELMQNRTTLIVAHRLSTISGVDRILVFEGGAVVEEGTPRALLASTDSRFRRLHDLQSAASAA